MPQPPLQLDALQIEPGEAGTRTIDRNPTTGAIRLIDPTNPTGVDLSSLAGLRSIQSIYMVGKAGSGAQYNTVQDALDAVPVTASLTAPALVLVAPGVYSENLTIEKDGIWLLGLGGAIIDPAADAATITIQETVTETPNWCRIQNLRVTNSNAGRECVLVSGGSLTTIGSTEIGIVDCELVASGVGSLQVRADTVNLIRVHGGTFAGSSSNSVIRATNCHRFSILNVAEVFNVQLDYDTANPVPSIVGCTYEMRSLTLKGDVQSTLNGIGTMALSDVVREGTSGDLSFIGDGSGSWIVHGSKVGDLTLTNAAPVSMSATTRGTATGAGTLAEDIQELSIPFAASASEAVVFAIPQPDDNYTVHPDTELTEAMGVTSRTASGFTLGFSGAQTTTVLAKILRRGT
jgi:hypothetical protein